MGAKKMGQFSHLTEFVLGHHNTRCNESRSSADGSMCLGAMVEYPDTVRIGKMMKWLQRENAGHCNPTRNVVIFVTLSSMEAMEAMLAVLGAGMVVVPVNWRWSVKEIMDVVGEMNPVMLVVDETMWSLGRQLRCRLLNQTRHGEHKQEGDIQMVIVSGRDAGTRLEHLKSMNHCIKYQDIVRGCHDYASISQLGNETSQYSSKPEGTSSVANATAEKTPVVPVLLPPDGQSAFVIFTSGTTSRPKGAIITHENMIVQCKSKEKYCGYSKDDIYLHAAPMFHVGGLCSALAMVMVGAGHVFMPSFRAESAIELIQTCRVSSLIVVPTMLRDIISRTEQGALDSLKTVLVGAGGISRRDLEAMKNVMPYAAFYGAYGMTEACSSLTFVSLEDPRFSENNLQGVSFVGQPPVGIHLAILQTASGHVSRFGTGEVLTRGPHLFLRYWDASHNVSSNYVLDECGDMWFRTGDLGLIQPDGVWLIGRCKDMIKTGGENVAPLEVEKCILDHPDIEEVTVVGIPHDRWGEMVAAAVVPACSNDCKSENSSLFWSRKITDFCKSNGLASFKIPKLVVEAKCLPRNATGKVIKSRVVDMILNKQAAKL